MCCSPWGHKGPETIECLNWTELSASLVAQTVKNLPTILERLRSCWPWVTSRRFMGRQVSESYSIVNMTRNKSSLICSFVLLQVLCAPDCTWWANRPSLQWTKQAEQEPKLNVKGEGYASESVSSTTGSLSIQWNANFWNRGCSVYKTAIVPLMNHFLTKIYSHREWPWKPQCAE